MDKRAIGFFDSGAGGISVLKRAMLALPSESFIYYGDSARAPYGTLSAEKILECTCAGADFLLAKGVKMLVIACNTATSAAARELRQRLQIPVVAMEPALKPAQAKRREGQIIVLATPATLALPRFKASAQAYGERVIPAPVFGLVELIEQGVTQGAAVERCLESALAQPLKTPTDVIVLGCTHYPFALESIRKIAGEHISVIDGGPGTVRQIARLLRRDNIENRAGGAIELYSSGGEQSVAVMRSLLHEFKPEGE